MMENKVLFVAGVGPLMGQATARIAAREGARVAVAARSADIIEQVATEIRGEGGTALAVQCDLSDEEQLEKALEKTAAELGTINCLFYNAAYYDHEHTTLDIDHEVWKTTVDVNLMGAMAAARRRTCGPGIGSTSRTPGSNQQGE